MKHPAVKLSFLFVGLVFLLVVALEAKTLARSMGWAEAETEPVLVFTIADSESLSRIRAAVRPERIVSEGEGGFAVEGGRVYTRDLRHAGDLIKSGGWIAKPVKVVSLAVEGDPLGAPDNSGTGSPLSREERMTRLRQLVHKPTLTRGEQLFVLQAMNDGLEI